MCKTFESGIVFKNLEEAERKCLTCQSGFVLIKAAADASGVCTPSVECSNFNDASFTDLASSVSKCYTCKSGFANIKALEANVFGTCTASTKCSDSSTPIALTLAVFEADCSKCASGFYKIAKVADTANCKEIPAAANCKLSFSVVIATDEDATAKCVLCKDGFYPKDAANNGYGPCTAIVRKYTCLAFLEGAATTELLFTTTKCALCP